MNTITGNMLTGIEQDLLRIGRELAANHALLNAATLVARGAAQAEDADEWYSEAEHLAPLLAASDQFAKARFAILQAVREVQGTNPIPARACTDLQHSGYPANDDEFCTVCGGSGYVAGIEREDWGPPVTIRRV